MTILRLALAVSVFFTGALATAVLDTDVDKTTGLRALAPEAWVSLDSLAWPQEAVSLLQVHAQSWPPSPLGANISMTDSRPSRRDETEVVEKPTESQTAHKPMGRADTFPKDKRVVWVNAFPRSGSSMMLNLLVQVNFPVFALFEPCSGKDVVEDWLAPSGCSGLLSQLVRCNFTGVKWIDHWIHGQTLKNGAGNEYRQDRATEACQSAGLVAIKTVTWGHDLAKEAMPFIRQHPHVQVIDLVRDPRSIYASMFSAGGFTSPTKQPSADELVKICDYMYGGLMMTHAHLLRVVYEDLIKEPEKTIQKIVSFVDIPKELGEYNHDAYMDWTFDNDDCNDADRYATCRSNSSEPSDRYTTLRPHMYEAFSGSKACRAISAYYGYDMWYGTGIGPKAHLQELKTKADLKELKKQTSRTHSLHAPTGRGL